MKTLVSCALLLCSCGSAPLPPASTPATSDPVTVPEPEETPSEVADEAPPERGELPSARVDSDGLRIEDIARGEGKQASEGDRVLLHYDGTLSDGTMFDSSRKRGQPFEVELGRNHLIPGFERGVIGMRPGGKRRVVVPPELGYGTQRSANIPPSSILIFEIELLEIR